MKLERSFNPTRLCIARLRRKFTYTALANKVGMTPKMLSLYEKETNLHVPPEDTLRLISEALDYPIDFFYGGDIEPLDASTVSFRSLKSLKAAQGHAAISAGQLGFLISEYFSSRFSLPTPDLPDLRGCDASTAAETMREKWGLGNKSIRNMVHLLESKGVKVFSLAENTADVDAFSFWKDGTPYVFLNTQKSAERSRFDAAHELAHLVLHKHGSPTGRDLETEADAFASVFLMPESSVIALAPKFVTIKNLLTLKHNWMVSLVSVIVRFKQVGILTEWQYRTLMIEASSLGYRSQEPNGIEREKSLLFEKTLSALKTEGIGVVEIARELMLPVEEVCNLLFMPTVIKGKNQIKDQVKSRACLTIIK